MSSRVIVHHPIPSRLLELLEQSGYRAVEPAFTTFVLLDYRDGPVGSEEDSGVEQPASDDPVIAIESRLDSQVPKG